MKWETIHKMRTAKSLIFIIICIAAIIYRVVTQGLTKGNITIIALAGVLCFLIAIIVVLMKKGK